MYQLSSSLNTLESLEHSVETIINAPENSIQPIKISEFKFQTVLSKYKRLKSPEKGVSFIFNLKDEITCLTMENGAEFHLGSFQSIMVPTTHSEHIHIAFPKNGSYHLCIISVAQFGTLGSFKDDYSQADFQSQNNCHFWYTGLPNIKLSSFVHDLMRVETTQLNNQRILAGYTNLIIGSKIVEHEDYMNASKKQVDLKNEEIQRIQDCINYIKENYAQQLDVEFLCATVSLSAQKLQTGFREFYGNTVTSFIRDFRLQIAEELMRTSELNVSQIVYSIGLTSRSYFSKIFKEKYETSPNEYIKKFKSLIL